MSRLFPDEAYDRWPCPRCKGTHMTFTREAEGEVRLLLGVDDGWGFDVREVVRKVVCDECRETLFVSFERKAGAEVETVPIPRERPIGRYELLEID